MSILALVVSLAGVVGLALQGGSCLLAKERPLSIGFLDLLLAGNILLVALLLYSGQMVLGTEFGTIMVQGAGNRLLLQSALVSTAVIPSLCLYRIRTLNKWRASAVIAVGFGLIFGLWAASRVVALNSDDLEFLRVFRYDVWWPPMIVWLTICFAGSVLALLKTQPLLAFAASAAALVSPLAHFALQYEDLADPQSRPVWTMLEWLGLGAASLLLLLMLFRRDLAGKGFSRRRMTSLAAVILPPSLILLAWFYGSSRLHIFLSLVPLMLLITAVAVLVAFRDPGQSTPDAESEDTAKSLATPGDPTPVQGLRRVLPIERLTGIAHALALPVIALGLTDLFSFGLVNRTLEVSILFCFWLLFAERLAEGALDTLPELFRDGVFQLTLVKRLWGIAVRGAVWIRHGMAAGVRFVTEGGPWSIVAKAILLPLLILLLLTVANEVLNYRHLVVQLFEAADDGSKNDVKAVTDGLINALGRMRGDLRTDLILAQRNSSGEHPTNLRFLQASIDSNTMEVAVAKSEDLKISGVQIPLSYFVLPIQRAVRTMLGIRVVAGSIRKTSDGRYRVWANSSDGESWERTDEAPALPPDSHEDDQCPLEGEIPSEPVERLAERLAFDIASSDPSFLAAGMTRDWQAFQYFRLGLKHWNNHEAQQDSNALSQAIGCFRAAVRRDQKFSLAFYRLGLAMQHDGQPGAAVVAFQESIKINRDFVPGALAEASTLYNFNDYYPPAASVLTPLPTTSENQRRASFKIWKELVELPRNRMSTFERRSSYYWICLNELDAQDSAQSEPKNKDYYLPYFYCSRAAALYSHLGASDREDPDERDLQAAILNALGVTMEHHHGEFRPWVPGASAQAWACSASAVDPKSLLDGGHAESFTLVGSRNSSAALRYYRESLRLAPTDPVVLCNAANAAAYLENNISPLEQLSRDPNAHFVKAVDLAQTGHEAARLAAESVEGKARATSYYAHALNECQAAIQIDSAFLDALIGYGGIFWQWQVDWLAHRTSDPPGRSLGVQAEQYARAALRLAQVRSQLDAQLAAERNLGEVLLGQGRIQEALQRLDSMIKSLPKSRWPGLTEVLWDSAQARLCDCARENSPRKRVLFKEALELFAKIRSSEVNREWQPFHSDPDALDPLLRQATCPDLPDRSEAKPLPYVMNADHTAGPSCEWAGIVGKVLNRASGGSLILHVWGGDVDQRIRLDEGAARSVNLEFGAPKAYYFAQLEDDKGNPLSVPRSFETYPRGECSRNQVTLVFAVNPLYKTAPARGQTRVTAGG